MIQYKSLFCRSLVIFNIRSGIKLTRAVTQLLCLKGFVLFDQRWKYECRSSGEFVQIIEYSKKELKTPLLYHAEAA